PFLLKLPKGALAGLRVGSQVRTVDVLPTILQLVGVEGIHGIHGESVVPLMLEPGREPPRYAYCESMAPNLQYGWSALYSVRTEEHKYISAPREELYSLLTDVGETSNVVAEHSELAQEMKMILEEIRQRIAEGAPQAEEANIDDQTLALLASLGYVGGSSGPYEGENLADPKDKLHLYQAIGLAAQLISDDDYAGAATQLQMVLQEDEEIPQARLLLATSYRKTGRSQEAKAILDNYLREDPESVQALITMAGLLSEEGKTQEVLAICQRALAVDDRNTQAYALMADVYMKSDDHERALPFLRTAVEIQPKLSRIRNNLAACLVGLEEFEEAEILLSGIVTSYPKFPLANFHLGLMHEEQKQFPQARSAYSREIELNPDSIRARFNLGNLLFGLGDMPGGEEQMRELMTRAPDMARPYLLLARAQLARSGDPREIEDLARKGLDRAEAPELKALGYFLLADAFSRQGRQSEIPEVVEKARFYQAQIGSETTH
ncbi:MAG: tetratricopeptide repeat protein, partial [bacterium]|nr:tetratricopeptide repeat protein [bacterium]